MTLLHGDTEGPAAASLEATAHRLEFSDAEMRQAADRTMTLVLRRLSGVSETPVGGAANGRHRRSVPVFREQASSVETVLDEIVDEIALRDLRLDHPRCFAFVPSPGNVLGVLADLLCSALNVSPGFQPVDPGSTDVELQCVRWLCNMCGLPSGSGGLFVSGGSLATLTALAAARQTRLGAHDCRAVVYFSDQVHHCVRRVLRVLGFHDEQLRQISSDERYCLRLDALAREVALDRGRGNRPFAVVATAGTTNTGAVDPLLELAPFCAAQNLWLHVDAALGAPALLTDEPPLGLTGIAGADSITVDPHKWLFQPIDAGCVLVRDGSHLRRTFSAFDPASSSYLMDSDDTMVDLASCGIELTRRARALKLWMSLQVFGVDAFRKAVQRGITLARVAEEAVRQSRHLEIVTPAQLCVVTFRYVPRPTRDKVEVDRINAAAAAVVWKSGFAAVATTRLRGRTVQRLCTINPRTTDGDVRETIRRLEAAGDRLASGVGA